jgi:type I restriction enzyme R subunit
MIKEQQIEDSLIAKLTDLKYTHRADIGTRLRLKRISVKNFKLLNQSELD